MQLKSVKVNTSLPALDGHMDRLSLRVGEGDVVSLTELNDGKVEVVATRGRRFLFWPGNVAWAEPMPATSPTLPSVPEGDKEAARGADEPPKALEGPSDSNYSAVAQLDEHVAVNHEDVGSTPTCGAMEAPQPNEVEASGSLAVSKTAGSGSSPDDLAVRGRRGWRKGKGKR